MNDDEAKLLQEIETDPDARLVYADWLEERGDPRAAFVRLEGELWALGDKATLFDRAELKRLGADFDPEWVKKIERVRVWLKAPERPPAPPIATKSNESDDVIKIDLTNTTKRAPAGPVPQMRSPLLPIVIPQFISKPWPTWARVGVLLFLAVGVVLVRGPKHWTVTSTIEFIACMFDNNACR